MFCTVCLMKLQEHNLDPLGHCGSPTFFSHFIFMQVMVVLVQAGKFNQISCLGLQASVRQ